MGLRGGSERSKGEGGEVRGTGSPRREKRTSPTPSTSRSISSSSSTTRAISGSSEKVNNGGGGEGV